jgi:hypothetical protein
MKVEKSSEACTKHNAVNAEYISAGLVEAWDPSDAILLQEAKAEQQRQAGKKRHAAMIAIVHAIWEALPENIRSEYIEPKIDPVATGDERGVCLSGQRVDTMTLEACHRSSGYFSSNFAYYWLEMGSYGDRTFVKLNTVLNISPKQITNAVAKLSERYAVRIAQNNRNLAAGQAAVRRTEWLKDSGNVALAKTILDAYHISFYSGEVEVHLDGRVQMDGKILTVAQWQEVAALKLSQKAAMAALFASFKPAPETISSVA